VVATPAQRFALTLERLGEDPGLVAQLDAAKVRYGSVRQSKWLGMLVTWVAPALTRCRR
jgi:hypothetical protein